MLNSQSEAQSNSLQIPSNIQQAIDKVWQNPLMQNLQSISERSTSLPSQPPKFSDKGE